MNEKFIGIVNKLSEEHAEQARANGSSFDVIDSFDLIEAHKIVINNFSLGRKDQGFSMENGCIKKDGKILGRVAMRVMRPVFCGVGFDEQTDYIEGKILARSEVF